MRGRLLVATAVLALLPVTARAAVVVVPPGASIQAAIDAAADGDVIQLEAGTYEERTISSGRPSR